MSQYAFSLPHAAVFSADTFFTSECNNEAYQWVQSWPNWPAHALIVYGPAVSGKTHLGHIWAQKAKATVYASLPSPETLAGNALLENIEQLADQQTLFHLLNIAKEQKFSLLLTSRTAPKQLPFTLPDLTSRLLALPAAAIAAPDDAALAAALRKQFADRQLKVAEDAIAYLVPRIERSFAAAAAAVNTLDAAALAEKKPVTLSLIKRILGF